MTNDIIPIFASNFVFGVGLFLLLWNLAIQFLYGNITYYKCERLK
jgi:hypothetical protein